MTAPDPAAIAASLGKRELPAKKVIVDAKFDARFNDGTVKFVYRSLGRAVAAAIRENGT
jgi:hypothetical protein